MGHIILQPAADKAAQINYKNTIVNPVNIEKIIPFTDKKTEDRIRSIYLDGLAYVWGVKNGKNNVNFNKWCKINPGDFTIFAADKNFFCAGVTTLTFKSRKLAEKLWGIDKNGETWENIYLLDEIKKIQLGYKEFNGLAKYKDKYVIHSFNVLDENKSERIINRLQLYSDYYYNEISDGEYKKEIEHLMDGNLDTVTQGTSRREQSYLRSRLFKSKKQEKCSICGEEFPVDLLVAAHIKRRADCTKEERLDIDNVVLPMCKMGCDDLYEKGYIFVERGFVKVNKNKHLTPRLESYLNKIEGIKCCGWKPEMDKYCKYHSEKI